MKEVRRIMVSWDVNKCAVFQSRTRTFRTDEDWTLFFVSCGAFVDDDISKSEIDLKKVLDHCYNLAFHMPSSPTARSRNSPSLRNGLISDALCLQ